MSTGVTVERRVRNDHLTSPTHFCSGFKPVKLQIFKGLLSVFVEYTLRGVYFLSGGLDDVESE